MKKTILFLVMAAALTTSTLFAQVPSYVPTNGLVGYWPFSGNANDISGNDNNGTNNGATLITDRFGNSNSAYSFDGNNDYISILRNYQNYFSVSIWVNTPNVSGLNPLIDGFDSNWELLLSNSFPNYISFIGNTYQEFISTTSIVNNTWTQIVCTYNSNIVKIYINGLLKNQYTVNPLPNNSGNYFFGASLSGDDQYYLGKLDDIGIWNRALTQEEITNLYNANQCITNITVTDTLIINVGQLSFNDPVTWANNITIFPNPASSQININFNNITNLNGGTLKIINSLGQEVATTPITTSGTQSTMQLATWGGTGMYFVQIINPQGQIVDIKKIILQ